jgi:hypothetical protein
MLKKNPHYDTIEYNVNTPLELDQGGVRLGRLIRVDQRALMFANRATIRP